MPGEFGRCKRAGVVPAARWRERSRIGRFLCDVRGGATGIVAGAVTLMTVGASALIVDHNWLVDQRDVLKGASDAAAIAATIEMKRLPPETSDAALRDALQQTARNYAALNLEYLRGDRLARAKDSLSVEATPQPGRNVVDVVTRADLGGTLFSRHLPLVKNYTGPDEIVVVAKVESLTSPVEVVLAIDISESMKDTLGGGSARLDPSSSRMAIVKRAASNLVDILDPDEENRVAVGVVPWQIVVRLDETARQNWVTKGWAEYPASRHYDAPYACAPQGRCTVPPADHSLPADPGEPWQGCLDEHRVDSRGHGDLPATEKLLDVPSDTGFAQAIFPALHAVAYECLDKPLPGNFFYQTCHGTESAAISAEPNSIISEVPAQRHCGDDVPAILPLTSDRAVIDTAIDALLPVGARTYSALGVLWGQRLLTHDWQQVWDHDIYPVDPDSEVNANTRKAVVLLTDGEDNPCGFDDPFCTTNDVGILRTTACSVAKAAGTEIFVVAAMPPHRTAGTLADALRACSSEADNPEGTYVFLNNSDAESLEAAFTDIAQQLQTVRRVY